MQPSSSLPVWLMFSYPVELHTKIPNKIRMFDAFKNLQFISCFFDGFVIIRLKSYLQETFSIILLLLSFKLLKNNNKKKIQKSRKRLKVVFFFSPTQYNHRNSKIPSPFTSKKAET